jgi:hypothetical protein
MEGNPEGGIEALKNYFPRELIPIFENCKDLLVSHLNSQNCKGLLVICGLACNPSS